jgi:signal transduction histidine kinase
LTNAAPYAAAKRVEIEAVRRDGRLRVELRDDGRGGADPAAGSGLRGLADRAAALDGELVVNSPPGGGTVLRLELPCKS